MARGVGRLDPSGTELSEPGTATLRALWSIAIAQAIALAVPTFGASLLSIPVVKEIIGRIINLLIDRSLAVLLG